MTDQPTTESRVRTVLLREGFPDDLLVSSKLCDDVGFDSLDRTELAIALEEEFPDVLIDLDDEDDWVTILDVVQYVDARKKP
jgi:acyl carrier protein